jgi:hypothetical protein
MIWVGDQFRMNTAVATASPQSQPGMDMTFIILLAMPLPTGSASPPPVLFWSIRGGEMTLYTVLAAVVEEVACRELVAAVSPQRSQFPPGFGLHPGLERHEGIRRLILCAQQRQPHIAAHVVDEEEEVFLACRSHRRYRPAQVTVNKLQLKRRTVLGLTGKR